MFTGFGRVEYCDAARTCQGGVMWDLGTMLNGGFDPRQPRPRHSVIRMCQVCGPPRAHGAARTRDSTERRLRRTSTISYFVFDCVKCEHVGIHNT